MKKTFKRIAAVTMAVMLTIPAAASVPKTDAASKKVPTLKAGMKSLFGTTSTTVKVKKNKAYKIVKTTWSLNKTGKKAVKLTKKKNTSVKVTARNVNGKATLTARVKYKVTKKAKAKTKKIFFYEPAALNTVAKKAFKGANVKVVGVGGSFSESAASQLKKAGASKVKNNGTAK